MTLLLQRSTIFITMLRNRAVHRRRATFLRRWSTVSINGSALTIDALNSTFPFVWLRDSCPSCSDCVHFTTSQKLRKTSDIQLNITPVDDGGVRVIDDGIQIKWKDGHISFFSESFLRRYSSSESLTAFHENIGTEGWDRARISGIQDLFLAYDSLRTSNGLLKAINQIRRYGLLFVTAVPTSETSDDKCELSSLAQLFGDIRTTFYGRLWDVVNVPNSKNIAYTNLDLGLHMDLLYFEHPPRYQILHCLRNKVRGGTSIFVDALYTASILRETHPVDFDVLATTQVAFHYINGGHHLYHEHPTIELVPPLVSGGGRDTVMTTTTKKTNRAHARMYINYSPPFQAPLPLSTPPEFYLALSRFARTADNPLNTYLCTLQEGDAVIFDNRRILHGRTAFSVDDAKSRSAQVEGGDRWLKGCYFEADELMDRGRLLRSKL